MNSKSLSTPLLQRERCVEGRFDSPLGKIATLTPHFEKRGQGGFALGIDGKKS